MKNNKYKILVLSDLKDKSIQTLSYAAKLSNEIDAVVELFHAKQASEVAEIDNPLSAMRVISHVCNKTDKKIKNLVAPIAKENNIKIKSTFAHGNVKNEIIKYITTSQPDMIIMGECRQKRFNFFGNRITQLVNDNYKGVVFVVTNETILDATGNVSLDNLGLKNNIANYNIKAKDKFKV